MHSQDVAVIKGLVPVAWADGEFHDDERLVIDALLDAYGASPDERTALREYAATPRTLDDIDLQELSADDRRVLLQHAVFVSFADGVQNAAESKMLATLAAKLRIPEDEAKALLEAGAERAERHAHLLHHPVR